MRVTQFVVFLLLFSVASSAWGNDSSFGGRGGDPMPLKNEAIEMVSEHVVLRADTDKSQWTVTTDFVFRNTTQKKVELQMGFPFVTNDGESDVAIPAGAKYAEAGDPLVWDFKTWVNGKEVKVKLQKAAPNPSLPDLHYDIVYTRKVAFGPGETVKVKNTYRHGISTSVMQDSWVHYVLRTGGLWKGGKIGRSQLEVHVPATLRLPPPGHVAYMKDNDGTVMRDKSGKELVLMKFEIKPPGARIERRTDGTSAFWDLRDFAPKSDLELSLVFDEAAPNYHMTDLDKFSDSILKKMSLEELRFARNTISAQHGYTFKAEDLQTYFKKKWWYVPNPKFNFDADLSAAEKDLVRKIKELEGKAPSNPASDPLKLEPPTVPTPSPVDEPTTRPPDPTPQKPRAATPPKKSGCATVADGGAFGWLLLMALIALRRR